MRILCVNQFFWPDSAPTGLLLRDLSDVLIGQGHSVDVVCGDSGYGTTAADKASSAVIYRVKTVAFSKRSLVRLVSWLSFLISATIRSIRLPRYDLVIVMTTPPGLSYLGWILRCFRGSPFWIWEMDVYPDVAFGTGKMRPDGLASQLLSYLMNRPRHAASGLIALGACMRDRLLSNGLPADKIIVAENWATLDSVKPRPLPSETNPLTVLYSGNLGLAHEIDTIASVMLSLQSDSRIQFIFAGGGARYIDLRNFCEQNGIGNSQFLPHQQPIDFANQIAGCHIGLVTLEPNCLGAVVPSKLYTLLAAGRPVLFIGPAAATTAICIRDEKCGWHYEAGDATGITALLQLLASDRKRVADAATHARMAHRNNHGRKPGLHLLAESLVTGVR